MNFQSIYFVEHLRTKEAFDSTSDPTKEAQETIFSRKARRQNHPNLFFNQRPAIQMNSQKHLVIFLHSQLNFKEHLPNIFTKASKTI